MFYSETRLTVRYAETDRMGIVHHSNYAVWFEAGRTDFIRKMGMPYSVIEEKGIMLPLSELKCSFKGIAKYEDEITVRTSIKEYTCARIVFQYEVFREGSEKSITIGETMHAWTNTSLRPINIKKHAPEVYELIQKAAEQKEQ